MMNPDFEVQKASEQDLPSIYELVKELAVYEKEPDAVSASLNDYQNDFRNNIFQSLVAKNKKSIAGMAIFYPAYSTWKGKMLFLEDIIVTKSYRNQGIGQLLFDAILKLAKEENYRLVKWQVLDWNEPAIKFYEKYNVKFESNWWNGKIFID
ncbi:MAG TPA: GNAT family N-acetyltransferase [Saprospiraceae bacterium]|nr:GNAT family N-acetyltransferase [Saprospiraceae bacterium]